MTTETIYYKPLIGRATKDVLRELSPQDREYLRRVMQAYSDLAQADPRPEFAEWYNRPNKNLPKQTRRGGQYNSPRSWCEGIVDKLNQRGQDLSPRQCEGIEVISTLISECYEQDQCPEIRFKNRLMQNKNPVPEQFTRLFKR